MAHKLGDVVTRQEYIKMHVEHIAKEKIAKSNRPSVALALAILTANNAFDAVLDMTFNDASEQLKY